MNTEAVIEEIFCAIQEHGLIKTLFKLFKDKIKIELGFTQQCCNTRIEELPISVRCYNALKRANLNSIGEIVTAINENTLLSIRNLGLKTRSEIRVITCEYGYECLSERSKKEFIRKTVKQYVNNCKNIL